MLLDPTLEVTSFLPAKLGHRDCREVLCVEAAANQQILDFTRRGRHRLKLDDAPHAVHQCKCSVVHGRRGPTADPPRGEAAQTPRFLGRVQYAARKQPLE